MIASSPVSPTSPLWAWGNSSHLTGVPSTRFSLGRLCCLRTGRHHLEAVVAPFPSHLTLITLIIFPTGRAGKEQQQHKKKSYCFFHFKTPPNRSIPCFGSASAGLCSHLQNPILHCLEFEFHSRKAPPSARIEGALCAYRYPLLSEGSGGDQMLSHTSAGLYIFSQLDAFSTARDQSDRCGTSVFSPLGSTT